MPARNSMAIEDFFCCGFDFFLRIGINNKHTGIVRDVIKIVHIYYQIYEIIKRI